VLARLVKSRAEAAGRQDLAALAAEMARQETTLRQELETSRGQAEARAQALRSEVVGTMTSLARTQEQRLDGFGLQMRDQLSGLRGEALQQSEASRQGLTQGLADARQTIAATLEGLGQAQGTRLETLAQTMDSLGQGQRERLERVAAELAKITNSVAENLERLRQGVEGRLTQMQASNEAKLEQMRATVDEKLQGTLETRLGESFRQVSEHLQKVHQSVGEMQELAKGVGDLKRVLGEVKTRGIWGEVQLGTLLEQVLTPEQYYTDFECPPGSGRKVEFAIRMPGGDGGEVLLPVDAKFPLVDYERLVAASEAGDRQGVEEAGKRLERFIKDKAKEVERYVRPPITTNFAVMFLPVEGLYAEVLRRSELVHDLHHRHRIMVAGPTTLYALLNSLQMGFRTLAIQQRSAEVWTLLEAVKTEFAKYGEVIAKVRDKLQQADKHLDKVSTRTRAIDRRLREVATLPDQEAQGLLGLVPGGQPLDEPDED
jgi:DNA recombination protein RmuC